MSHQQEPSGDTLTWLHGIVPPVITPLDADGRPDRKGLARQIQRLVGAGVHGIFVLGSTGETAYLDDLARRAVVEVAAGEVSGELPVLVGVMATSPVRVAALAARLTEGLEVSGLVVTAPFYGRIHPSEIERHFRDIADVTQKRLVAYDVPGAVHTSLGGDLLAELAEDGVIHALKDSSGSDTQCRRLVVASAVPPDFSILTGSQLAVDAALFGGIHGAVPGLANVDPGAYVRLFDHMQAGRYGDARAEQDRLVSLFDLVTIGDPQRMGAGSAGVGSFKAAVHLLGVTGSANVASPLVPLDSDETERVKRHLVAHGLL